MGETIFMDMGAEAARKERAEREPVTAAEAQATLDDAVKFESELEKWRQGVLARMSPAGTLGLPALLDKRRLEYGIVDAAFRIQALYERIFIWQIADVMDELETYGEESRIVRADSAKLRARESAPRGIIISAGLKALDVLHSNGSGLGDIISLQYLAPFRRPIDRIDGKDVYMVVLNVGDLVGSEDVRARIVDGSVVLHRQVDNGRIKHAFVNNETGEMWHPEVPWTPADY